jgi:hypothetical protein
MVFFNAQQVSLRLAVLAIVVLVGTSPALAEWQWTTWYMPKKEVIAASGETVGVPTGRGIRMRDPDLAANVVEYHVPSTAYFQFYSDDGLQMVEIVPRNPGDCDQLLKGLEANLGGGDRSLDGTKGATAVFWRDEKRGNLVDYIALEGRCTVTYKGLAVY